MLKKLFIILLILNSLGLHSAEVQVISQKRLSIENVDQTNIIKSLAYLESGGTGIFVSPYHVLLPKHALSPCGKLKLFTEMLPGKNLRPLGRNVGCDNIVFVDETLDMAVITVNKAVKHFYKLSRDARIQLDKPVVMLGYTAAGFVINSFDCKIIAERGSRGVGFPQLGGEINFQNMAVADCIGLAYSEGAPVFHYKGSELILSGLYTMGDSRNLPQFTSIISKLGEVMSKYPDEFEDIFRASGVQ